MHSNNNLFIVSKIDNQPHSYFFEYLKNKKIKYYCIVISNNNLEGKKHSYNFNIDFYENKKKKLNYFVSYNNFLINDFVNQFLNFYHSIFFFYKIIKKQNFSFLNIFSENIKLSFISILLKKKLNIKKIYFFNGDILPTNSNNAYFQHGFNFIKIIKNFIFIKLTIVLKKFCLTKCDHIIYSSNKVRLWDNHFFNINLKQYTLIPNPNNYQLCKSFSVIRKKSLNLIYFGNLNKNNGIEEIILLAKRLHNSNLHFSIKIVGGSDLLINYYKNLINNMNLNKYFFFTGRVNNLFKREISKNNSFGIAPYFFNKKKEFSYVDNGKINDYLSLCLPVITTNYSFRSKDIKKNDLGLVSNNMDEIFNYLTNMSISKYNSIIRNIVKYCYYNDYKNFLDSHGKIFR